ncbi:lipid-A-disaccharide kinase [Belliella buryatensis]|uniref:Tetraacyldisaccharide 4'-kinase n=1 Tax=Belliella buryatensis TaxID=1500549 RepID=A0A239AGD2_9BACT|nr:tetraacyldisaccharide 4'-kinase [Belliella buryatensis]SNR94746.1 lipid-A-disaccharide kinase [Belliella buryatensis]
MRWFEPLLFPFSLLYDAATSLRNYLFDIGHKKSINFDIPTIVVGNLSLGGTGKTPFTEFLIRMLADDFKVATLSRGYGRKTSGFFLANDSSDANQLGDEPFQIFGKFKDKISVAVGEDRVMAIPQIIAERPETEVVLLDDAFQHRYVKGDLNIMLTTFQRPFFEDRVVPLGTLREAKGGASRADIIIVTKCPDALDKITKATYHRKIRNYNQRAKIFFVGLKYGQLQNVLDDQLPIPQNFVLVSGIANDQLFKKEVEKLYQVPFHFSYSDHHHYKVEDVKEIVYKCNEVEDSGILTTEKDAVKLKASIFRDYLAEIPIFAMPVEINMDIEDANFIKESILQIIKEKGYSE